MSIIVFQHSVSGHAGRLASALFELGYRLDVRRVDEYGDHPRLGVPPNLNGVDGVVMMGGAGYVTDAPTTRWMQLQGAFIKQVHEAGLPLVGICLGAQMIGQVLGGTVGFKPKPAAGMHELTLTGAGQLDPVFAGVPWRHPQFYSCSQEVTQLPPGATLLASTPETINSAFRVGNSTYAFQSHPECDRAMLATLCGECGEAFAKAGVAQAQVATQLELGYDLYDRCCTRIMDNLAAMVFRGVMSPR